MNKTALGNRIVILGCSGSGKSTLARSLQALTGLPLIHLDNVWWRADRTHISREAFDRKLAELLQGRQWIIDGNYSRTYEPRIRACDTVIFLDYSEEACMRGITERVGQARPDIPWTENQLDPELAAFVRSYREECRPRVYELLEKYSGKQAVILRDRAETQAWLDGLKDTSAEADERSRG